LYWQKGLATTACCISATTSAATSAATSTTAAPTASATTATAAELFHNIFSEANLASVWYQDRKIIEARQFPFVLLVFLVVVRQLNVINSEGA
jgi:activator of HSP90 ATPase